MPSGAIYVGRPTKWGNPYGFDYSEEIDQFVVHHISGKKTYSRHASSAEARLACVELYRLSVLNDLARDPLYLDELRGKDLVCWCAPGQSCHADVLLELAARGRD